MRISDWSSDVCSSDLVRLRRSHRQLSEQVLQEQTLSAGIFVARICDDEYVDCRQVLVGWKAPQGSICNFLLDGVDGKRADAETRDDHPPYLFEVGRHANNLAGHAQFVPPDRKSTRLNSSQ